MTADDSAPSSLLIALWADPPASGSALYSIAAGAAMLVAVVGSMTAVSLLVYSPTKLARQLKTDVHSQILVPMRSPSGRLRSTQTRNPEICGK